MSLLILLTIYKYIRKILGLKLIGELGVSKKPIKVHVPVSHLTLSSFFGSCSLIRALVLLKNQGEIFFTRALTVFLPVARVRLVALCLWPCSTGSENLFLKCPKWPRQPGTALDKDKKNKELIQTNMPKTHA